MHKIRWLLFPFSILYGCILSLRAKLYEIGVFKRYEVPGKSIVVGNLSTGGTGKSPHVKCLYDVLQENQKIAILSRGYGRKTKGYREVFENDTAKDVGDEPLMLKSAVGENTVVAVCESRKTGVQKVRKKDATATILFDDAFQHLKVKAGYYILLTEYNKPLFSDYVLPTGNLREFRCARKRADCIVVTKCPNELSTTVKQKFKEKLKFQKPIFFSRINYGELIPFGKTVADFSTVLLVTGIANPQPLENHLKQFYQVVSMNFADHHQFTSDDVQKIHHKFDTFERENAIIVTTEKDYVKLGEQLTENEAKIFPWHYQSISVEIAEKEKFKEEIEEYVRKN